MLELLDAAPEFLLYFFNINWIFILNYVPWERRARQNREQNKTNFPTRLYIKKPKPSSIWALNQLLRKLACTSKLLSENTETLTSVTVNSLAWAPKTYKANAQGTHIAIFFLQLLKFITAISTGSSEQTNNCLKGQVRQCYRHVLKASF